MLRFCFPPLFCSRCFCFFWFFSSVKSISKNQNLATLQSTVDHVVKQTLRVSWFGQRWSSDCVLFVWFVFSQCNVHHHGLSALSTPMNEWMNECYFCHNSNTKKKKTAVEDVDVGESCCMSLARRECRVGLTEAKWRVDKLEFFFSVFLGWEVGGWGRGGFPVMFWPKCVILCVCVWMFFLDQNICKSEKWTLINRYLMIQEGFFFF